MGFFDHHIISTSLPIATLGWMHTEKWQWHPPPCWLFRSLNRDVLVEDGIAAIAATALLHAACRRSVVVESTMRPAEAIKKDSFGLQTRVGHVSTWIGGDLDNCIYTKRRKHSSRYVWSIQTNYQSPLTHTLLAIIGLRGLTMTLSIQIDNVKNFDPVISLHRGNSIIKQHLSISI